MSTEGLKALLAQINEGVNKVIAEMETKGINEPTFDPRSPDEYHKLDPITWIGREVIASQLQDLGWLLLGPQSVVNSTATNVSTVMIPLSVYEEDSRERE